MIALHNSGPQVRNLPVKLSPAQVADPYLMLTDFFSRSNYLPVYRKRLKRWFLAALSGEHKWKRNALVRCLYTFENVGRLMEALWLINVNGDSFSQEDIALRQDEEEGDVWTEDITEQLLKGNFGQMAFHPEFITMEEEEDPYGVIQNFFKGQDLFEAKQTLEFWFQAAVENHDEYHAKDRHSLVHVFEQTNRIIEAAFIITEVRQLRQGQSAAID